MDLLTLPLRLVAGTVRAIAVPVISIAMFTAYGALKVVVFPTIALIRTVVKTMVALFGPPLVQLAKIVMFTVNETWVLLHGVVITPGIALAHAVWVVVKKVLTTVWKALSVVLRTGEAAVNSGGRFLKRVGKVVKMNLGDPVVTLIRGAWGKVSGVGAFVADKALIPMARFVRNTATSTASFVSRTVVKPAVGTVKQTLTMAKDLLVMVVKSLFQNVVRPTGRAVNSFIIQPIWKIIAFTARITADVATFTGRQVRTFVIRPLIYLLVLVKDELIVPLIKATVAATKRIAALISLHVLVPAAKVFTTISNAFTATIQYLVTHYGRELRYLWFLVCGLGFLHILIFWPFPLNLIVLVMISIVAVVVDFIIGSGRGARDYSDLRNSQDIDQTMRLLASRDRAAAAFLASTREARLQNAIFGTPLPILSTTPMITADGRMSSAHFLALFRSRLRKALAGAIKLGALTTEEIETIDPVVVLCAPGLAMLQTIEDEVGSGQLESVNPPYEFEPLYMRFLVEVLGPVRQMLAHPSEKEDKAVPLHALKLYIIGGQDALNKLNLKDNGRNVITLGKTIVGLSLAITKERSFQSGFAEDVSSFDEDQNWRSGE